MSAKGTVSSPSTDEVVSDSSGFSSLLSSLDLTTVRASEIHQLVASEAIRLTSADEAALWTYCPGSGRLACVDATGEMRLVPVSETELQDSSALSNAWSLGRGDLFHAVLRASFGAGIRTESRRVVGAPLIRMDGAIGGFLILSVPAAHVAQAEVRLAVFIRQVAALVANFEALEEARRHKAELESLYVTAGVITAELDLARVLCQIAQSARTLLSTPISYIMLVDDAAKSIRMRTTVGTTSRSFARLALELGAGLGGLVLQQEQPFHSRDYLNDPQFQHRAEVDNAVREEKVKSILGVPMQSLEKFVGVLYVADRQVRDFEAESVELLTSLAGHAALAIENATLYERQSAMLKELRSASALAESRYRQLQRLDNLHRNLSEVVLAGHGVSGVASSLAELIKCRVLVADERGHVLAASASDGIDDFGSRLMRRGIDGVASDHEIRQVVGCIARCEPVVLPGKPPARLCARLIIPIVARAELLGSLWVDATAEEPIDDLRPMLEQAARVFGLELLKERAVTEAERRLHRDFVHELLRPADRGSLDLRRWARQLGIRLEAEHRLAVIRLRPGPQGRDVPDLRTRSITRVVQSQSWCLFASEWDDGIIALVAEGSGLETTLDALDREGIRAVAVVSPVCGRAEDYAAHFEASQAILRVIGSTMRHAVIQLDQARVLALLFDSGRREDLVAFAQARLAPVLALRSDLAQTLIDTLEAHLESGGSPRRTSERLHVHVNTVYYRLTRLRQLLGSEIDDPLTTLDLRIALLAHRLLHVGSAQRRDVLLENPSVENAARAS